jgi:D-alanyl-D-alanine carboxypeptidase
MLDLAGGVRRGTALVAAVVITPIMWMGATRAGADGDPPPAVEALQAALDDVVRQPGGPPGVLVTLGQGSRLTVQTAGVADVTTARAPQVDEAMRIASAAKAFNAATALALVSDGVLSLDDRVGSVTPELPQAWADVTLRDLLGHTSGIPDFSREPGFVTALLASLDVPPPHRDLLSYVEDPALRFAPGTRYEYSNSDNIVAALMIEAATGGSYEAALDAAVLGPAGLSATSLPDGPELPAPYLHGYDVSEQPHEDVSTLVAAGWSWASGGIVSTPADLARFIGADVRGAFTGADTRAEQFRFRPGTSEPPGPGENSAGLGLFRYDTPCGTVYGHTGNTPGYTQFAAATEDGQRTVTVSVNGQITPSTSPEPFEQLRHVFELAVCAALSSDTAASDGPPYADALQPVLDQLVHDLAITGGAVLVRSPQLGNWTATIGTRTWHGTEPVTLADHVRIGSNTKTWTGTVVLQLVDEGRIRLDDPVSRYRPDVPNGDAITIAQLLDMSSGLANYTTDLELNRQLDEDPGRVWTPEELLAIGLAEPPAFPPGEGYLYSNTNTVLLGLIIEQLTGVPVAQAFQTRIFDPLGLTQTSFPAVTDASIPEPHPQTYTFGTNVDTIDSLVLPPEVQAGARDGTLEPMDVTDLNPSWAWTAGGGISTAEDLADYVEALVGGRLLSPELQQQRIASVQPIVPGDPASPGYGFALAAFGPLYGHTGELPGTNSFMGHDPVRDITVVTWTSTAPAADGRGPAVELAKAVIAELYAA